MRNPLAALANMLEHLNEDEPDRMNRDSNAKWIAETRAMAAKEPKPKAPQPVETEPKPKAPPEA